MAHCPPELLDDVADVVAELRTWAGVVEKKPGVFYLGRQPFLTSTFSRALGAVPT